MNKYYKLIILLLFIIIINIIFYFILKSNNNFIFFQKEIQAATIDEDKKDNPLTIEELRKRSYGNGKIEIIKDLGIKDKYKSYIISYYSDGLKLYALMNVPNIKKPVKGYPVIIVNHGHIPPDQYSTENSYKYVAGYYANNGFLVLKPDYRGHAKSEDGVNNITDRLSYAIDVLNLLYLVPTLVYSDTNNIFMYGHSMGGGITLTVLEVADNIKAATLWAAVSIEFPESVLYFRRKRNLEESNKLLLELESIFSKEDYSKLSPINYLQYIKVPLIIQHGTKDDSVPIEWSDQLEVQLKKNNINYNYIKYQNEDHNFAKGAFYKVLKEDVNFFKKYIN